MPVRSCEIPAVYRQDSVVPRSEPDVEETSPNLVHPILVRAQSVTGREEATKLCRERLDLCAFELTLDPETLGLLGQELHTSEKRTRTECSHVLMRPAHDRQDSLLLESPEQEEPKDTLVDGFYSPKKSGHHSFFQEKIPEISRRFPCAHTRCTGTSSVAHVSSL